MQLSCKDNKILIELHCKFIVRVNIKIIFNLCMNCLVLKQI